MIIKIKRFFLDIYKRRDLLLELAKRDLQRQYMGSYLGLVWVYLQPLLFILVLYFIFTIGLKAGHKINGVPFIVYLIVGIVPWFYIANNLNTMTSVIIQYSFLLKKVDFRISLLPIVKLMSSLVPHIFLVFVAFIVLYINHIAPSIYMLQLIYYYICMLALLLGVGWLTSSTRIFIPDVSNVINLIVTFGFWLTPVFWNINRIPHKYYWIVNLNPIVYIVEGYRDSMIYHKWFWEKPYETLYYWFITIFIMFVGIVVFRRLRPHFAEVV